MRATRSSSRRSTRARPSLYSPPIQRTRRAASRNPALASDSKPVVKYKPRVGVPGTRDLIRDRVDALAEYTRDGVTIASYLNEFPVRAAEIEARVYAEYRAVCSCTGVPAKGRSIVRLRDWLLTVRGRHALQTRLNVLRGHSRKQLRHLETIAQAHPNGVTRMEICLLRDLRYTMQALGVIAPAPFPRVDCPACLGTNLPHPGRRTRWFRHDLCDNWVCGACVDRLRALEETFTPRCPSCRAPLIGGQEMEWPGYVEIIGDVEPVSSDSEEGS